MHNTLVQVASNDLIILIAYIPIVSFLLKIGNINIPWETLFLSILLFIVVPLILSIITRGLIIKKQGENYLNNKFITNFLITKISLNNPK